MAEKVSWCERVAYENEARTLHTLVVVKLNGGYMCVFHIYNRLKALLESPKGQELKENFSTFTECNFTKLKALATAYLYSSS